MSRSFSPPPDAHEFGPLDRVEELLGACLELPEQEWEAEIERLCARHPEDAPALRRRFAALQRAGLADSGSRQMHDLALVEDLARREPEVASALAEAAGVDPRSVPGLSADPRAGTLLDGRYELIARLGAGAMGVVYRGLDRELGREVAIKLLDPARFADAKAEARFLQEAELLAALRHDSVVVLYDRGRSAAGELFLVMELLDGVPLTRVLEGRIAQTIASAAAALGVARLAETTWVRQVARWGADLADGLAAVHRAGILHRDVKPANVFVRRDGRAVLLDFGIATRGGDLTAAGTVLGTPWYMAPEQALGDDELTAALDVYGLCSCLYHLLAGQPPFHGEPLAVLARIARDDPPRLSAVRPDLPRDVRAIVETGMARRPADRYASMQALADDLRAFLDHRPVRARPLSVVQRAFRSARRRPARSALAVTAAALVVVGAGYGALAARQAEQARRERKAELWARLPESLAFEGSPEQRLLEIVRPEHREYLAILDELVALDPTDVPPLLWRAALHLDEGEHDLAARDLAAAARAAPTPYMRAVAARYARALRDVRGTKAIDLRDLGVEPSTPADFFVAGFHELRNRHVPGFARRADEWLAKAGSDYLPARDLRLLALVARGELENPVYFQIAINESLRVEGVFGRQTARTCALRGAALAALGRSEEALVPLKKALELRPGRHSPLQNLAVAHRALGNIAEAKHFVERARAVRPHFANTAFLRAQILTDAGEFDAARAVVAAVPEDGAPSLAWQKPYLLATIATEELCAAYRKGLPKEVRAAAAARGLAALDEALPHMPEAMRPSAVNRRALIEAFRSDDRDAVCVALLRHLADHPGDGAALRNVAALLPEQPAQRTVEHMRLLLAVLAWRTAPQDNEQKQIRAEASRRIRELEQPQPTPASQETAK